jgi:VCBS repeat-containing protein
VKRIVFLTFLAVAVLSASAVAQNSIVVTSLSVEKGATGVVIPVMTSNEEAVRQLVLPLIIREQTPGAFITSLQMEYSERLLVFGTITGIAFINHYSVPDGTCKDGQPGGFSSITNTGAFSLGPVAVTDGSPEGVLFSRGRTTDSNLQPGSDVDGSIIFTVDVTSVDGAFEIDTTCANPANHLLMIRDAGTAMDVEFTKGVITIGEGAQNSAPVANDDAYNTNEDTPLNVAAPGVLDNDTDADGDALTAVLDTDVSNGTLTLNSDGSFDYTPDADFNGADQFTYYANDGTDPSTAPATVTITVDPVNDLPVANDDSYNTDEDIPLNASAPGVLGNDTDADGDALTAVLDTDVSNGTLTLNADGSFDYTPDADFNGADQFTYYANDGTGNSASAATVTITVDPVNDLPVANDDAYNTNEDTPLNVGPGVLANDVDVDGDALTAVLDTDVSNGTLTLNADGSFSYTPDADFNGADQFTYYANDGTANSASPATVTITVTPVNDLPVAIDDAYVTDQDTPLSISVPGVLTNDADADGDALTAVLNTDVSNGTLALNADGSFDYTPNAGFNGADQFTYYANDGTANSPSPATVTITVNPVNDPPVANDDAYNATEDVPLNVIAPGVLDNDTDADGDALTAVLDTDVSNGTLTLNGNGSFSYTPDPNFNGSDQFTYYANDGIVNSASPATVTISVDPVNDLPVANDDAYNTNQDTPLNVGAPGVLTNDADVDGDPLTAVLNTDVTNGTLTLNANGSFDYTPNAGFNGADQFTYYANDGTANSAAPATVTINVTNVSNTPPVAVDDHYGARSGVTLFVAAAGVLTNDTDSDGQPLTAVLDGGVSHGSLTLNANGSFLYQPDLGYIGLDQFTYYANDGIANSATPATVNLHVRVDGPVAQGDFDEDGELTMLDLSRQIDVLFTNGYDPTDGGCSANPRGDMNCDGFTTALDLSLFVDFLLANGTPPCDPCVNQQ